MLGYQCEEHVSRPLRNSQSVQENEITTQQGYRSRQAGTGGTGMAIHTQMSLRKPGGGKEVCIEQGLGGTGVFREVEMVKGSTW